METEKETEKENILNVLKMNSKILVYVALIAIIIYAGIYVRTLNMGGLIDVSTNSMTLAPDLDPYLYLRWAKEVVANGSIAQVDTMRYVPLGYQTSNELTLPVYLIVDLYKFLNLFSPTSIEYAAVIFPVIFFCLFLVAFFLFVRKVLSDYKGSDWMAVIATGIMSIIPGLLHRTLAGVPEKEAGGLCMMFFALYFLVCAFKSEKTWKAIVLGLLAGLSTGFMGLLWGGVTFMFAAVPLSIILILIFSEIKNNDILAYAGWTIGFTLPMVLMTTRYGIGMISPILGGFAYLILILLVFMKIFKNKLIAIIALTIFMSSAIVIINPQLGGHNFLQYLSHDILNYILKPFASDRITMTVAENNLAYFGTWLGSFGTAVFWFFILGASLLSYESLKPLGKKGRLMSSAIIILIMSMVLSRYSPSSSSDLIFFVGLAFFIICLGVKMGKEGERSVDKGIILLLSITLFSVFCSRSAIRLFYFVYPIVPIFIGFIVVRIFSYVNDKNDLVKYISWIVISLIVITIPASLISYNNGLVYEARVSKTNYYEAQWQEAMSWVREETPKDAVFAHWWDYGYWVQTLGERATILDGGNAISYWNYLMGRYVLTGDINNETTMIEYLKTHKATHLLIDSSDIGKYQAYSTIGSDNNYDRLSFMQTFLIDDGASQEKRNETLYLFRGYAQFEDDLYYNGTNYYSGSAVVAFIVSVSNETINQPSIVVISRNKQYILPVRCIYVNGEKIEFDSGISGCIYTMPSISPTKILQIGAGLWLSPRLMKSEMVHLYILQDRSDGFVNVHNEQSPIINELNSQYNLGLPEIIFHSQVGVIGPIKIWEINYSFYPTIEENPEYLSKIYPSKELWEVK